jgi:hypothetical protein
MKEILINFSADRTMIETYKRTQSFEKKIKFYKKKNATYDSINYASFIEFNEIKH